MKRTILVAVFFMLFAGVNSQTVKYEHAGEFVLVPAGEFQKNGDPGNISKVSEFYICKYEITQEQYQDIMGSNPSDSKGKQLPIGNVNFYSVVVFCNRISLADGLVPVYSMNGSTDPSGWGMIPDGESKTWNDVKCDWTANGYRLPTEMENAWASMGASFDMNNREKGYLKKFSGDNGNNNVDDYCWHGFENNAGKRLHEIGTKKPNELGIHDMSGNSTEWLWDLFDKTDPSGELADYHGPAAGGGHIAAGGCWLSQDVYLRVYLPADRKGALWSRAKYDYVGIRLAKNSK